MNRRIKKYISEIRVQLGYIEDMLDQGKEEPTEEEDTTFEEDMSVGSNWSAADEPAKDTVYIKDLKQLTKLKDITITGQIDTVFDLKSYIHPKTQEAGILYRLIISDETDKVVIISFDKMATKLKEYPIGTCLRITNAWMMKENKHGKMEMHIGNFAKVEVVE